MNPISLLLAMLAALGGLAGAAGGSREQASSDNDPSPGLAGSPKPVKPVPVKPVPVDPVDNGGADNGSGGSTGGDTGGSPKPVKPAPVQPAPVQPVDPVAPVEPVDGGNTGGGTGGNTGGGTGGSDPVIPTPPQQSGGQTTDGASTDPVDSPTSVIAGRVTTIAPEGQNITALRILDMPDHGHLSVNPDNTLALVMTLDKSYVGRLSFSYETTHADGSTAVHNSSLNVVAGRHPEGWATSENHYMLQTDENDNLVIEHGDNHRKVYVSGSEDALTLADIAAREGVSLSAVNGSFLAARPEYGASEGMALAEDAGRALWGQITGRNSESSNWLLLEKGYEYDTIGRLVARGADGQSELHPLYIGSWGEGAKPVISETLSIFGGPTSLTENIVFSGLHFTGSGSITEVGRNIIFDDITVTGRGFSSQYNQGITFRNSEFYDIHREDPLNTGDTWSPGVNRSSGIYANHTQGLLIDGNFFDQIGWEDDYRFDLSIEGGQPPSMFSHNLYLGAEQTDATVRDTIFMRAASFGMQGRPGGFFVGNAFIDGNGGVNFIGGDTGEPVLTGNYTLFMDNVVTSAAYKTVSSDGAGGARNWGVEDRAHLSSLVDNIVAHMADPNNPSELTYKTDTAFALRHLNDPYYDDTIIYNWQGANPGPSNRREEWEDRNVDGLNPTLLDQTTIQLFAAQLLGDPDATIADLAMYLRAQSGGAFDEIVDAELIVNFFQTGFGIAPDIRTTAEALRFAPSDVGEGVRWDNSLNWTTGDLPGSVSGDSVDLGGNQVVYGGTTTIRDLDFGARGGLIVNHGRLDVTGELTAGPGATLDIARAGQFWTNGYEGGGMLDIDQIGGRFVNTGDFRGPVDFRADAGQTILATDDATFALTAGSRLEIVGADARVGFDGNQGGLAILGLGDNSTLAFTAENGTLGQIAEFRSGAFGEATDVKSGIDLGRAALEIDLTGLTGSSFTLMQVDELIGTFEAASFVGLGSRNAQVMIDYETDTVSLSLSSGTGAVSIRTTGAESAVSDGYQDLWSALTAGRGTWDETRIPDEEDDLLDAA